MVVAAVVLLGLVLGIAAALCEDDRPDAREDALRTRAAIRRINRRARADMLRVATQRRASPNSQATAPPVSTSPSGRATVGRATVGKAYRRGEVIDGEVVD